MQKSTCTIPIDRVRLPMIQKTEDTMGGRYDLNTLQRALDIIQGIIIMIIMNAN